MAEKLDMTSKNWLNENTQFIAERFPNCVTETEDGLKVDFELLQQELSGDLVSGSKERYRLEWPGKRQAMVNASLPTTKTLRPVREDSVDFDNTENLYIEGDNLEVLKILQESYLGKIKMIYIDPPYNTGKDFVYKDNFTQDSDEYKEESGQTDEYNRRLVSNPDTSGRYHSDWLSMMYPRLKLARNLLTEDGVIVVSIDENEVENLKLLLNAIFGSNNFSGEVIWKNTSRNDQKFISFQHEYFLTYCKNKEYNSGNWSTRKEGLDVVYNAFQQLHSRFSNDWDRIHKEALAFYRSLSKDDPAKKLKHYNWMDERGPYFPSDLSGPNVGQYVYSVTHPITGLPCKIPSRGWVVPESKMLELIEGSFIHFGSDESTIPNLKTYLQETESISIPSVIEFDSRSATKKLRKIFGSDVFNNPKDPEVLATILGGLDIQNGDIFLDFFSGSGTIAEASLIIQKQTRKSIHVLAVQIPENLQCMLGTSSGTAKTNVKNAIAFLEGQNRNTVVSELAKHRWRHHCTEDDFAGFRVYRVDESNMEDVYYQPQTLDQGNMDMFASNIKADRTSEDLLTQVLLDWGLPLTLKTLKTIIEGKEVFKVAGDSLYACFDEGLDEAFAKTVAAEKPLRLVVKDSAFASDTAKVNVQQLLKQLSPNTELKVL